MSCSFRKFSQNISLIFYSTFIVTSFIIIYCTFVLTAINSNLLEKEKGFEEAPAYWQRAISMVNTGRVRNVIRSTIIGGFPCLHHDRFPQKQLHRFDPNHISDGYWVLLMGDGGGGAAWTTASGSENVIVSDCTVQKEHIVSGMFSECNCIYSYFIIREYKGKLAMYVVTVQKTVKANCAVLLSTAGKRADSVSQN